MQREIIVTKNFDKTKILGKLILSDDKDFKENKVFAPAYKKKANGEIELLEVSLIPDEKYIKFVKEEKSS